VRGVIRFKLQEVEETPGWKQAERRPNDPSTRRDTWSGESDRPRQLRSRFLCFSCCQSGGRETHLHSVRFRRREFGNATADRQRRRIRTEPFIGLLHGRYASGASTSKRGTISCALSDREARRRATTTFPLIIMPRATNVTSLVQYLRRWRVSRRRQEQSVRFFRHGPSYTLVPSSFDRASFTERYPIRAGATSRCDRGPRVSDASRRSVTPFEGS